MEPHIRLKKTISAKLLKPKSLIHLKRKYRNLFQINLFSAFFFGLADRIFPVILSGKPVRGASAFLYLDLVYIAANEMKVAQEGN